MPWLYLLGNKVLTVTSNLCTGMKLTDVWTGYKVFRREALQSLELREDRFGFEPEVTARIAKAKYCGYVNCPSPMNAAAAMKARRLGGKMPCGACGARFATACFSKLEVWRRL